MISLICWFSDVVPSGDVPSGDVPSGDVPSGDVPSVHAGVGAGELALIHTVTAPWSGHSIYFKLFYLFCLNE